MKTKHTPATPLPWEALGDMVHCGDDHPRIIAASFDRSAASKRGDEQNAAYAAHACNEYPKLVEDRAKLVEALREVRREMVGKQFIVGPINRLLREIGEDA